MGAAHVRYRGRVGLLHRGEACRKAYPNHYIKVTGYNARYTKQTIGLAFIVNRPKVEPGFRLDRTETNDRHITFNMHAYTADTPHGTRYQGDGDGPEPD